ncbi:MAG TPA: type II secretion system protein [Candidatus Saccharimonadales bacterium]|nr:type II secretion system protein [Candidatus Saccharimonadales bacterium]
MKNIKNSKDFWKMKSRRNSEGGFTIIEVLIVLAIAGLILLIVFLAVPALQRNSRNTQRKNDVSALLGAVNEFTSNNQGTLPTTTAQVTANAQTGYYVGAGTGQGQVNLLSGSPTQGALPATAAGDRVVIVTGARCVLVTGVPSGATQAGSARQIAVQYQLETSGGWTPTCQQS